MPILSFQLNYDYPSDFFHTTRTTSTDALYNRAYSVAILCLCVASFGATAAVLKCPLLMNPLQCLVYYTMWLVLIYAIDIVLGFVISCRYDELMPKRDAEELPGLLKCHWVIHTLALNAAIYAPVLFWSQDAQEYDFHSFNFCHLMPPVATHVPLLHYAALACVVATPILREHIYMPIIGHALYMLLLVIHHFNGGKDLSGRDHIYPGLNFGNAPAWVSVVMVLTYGLTIPAVLHWILCACHMAVFRRKPTLDETQGTVTQRSQRSSSRIRMGKAPTPVGSPVERSSAVGKSGTQQTTTTTTGCGEESLTISGVG